ncbi:MAG: preprotein translocase subunit SecB [Bacteroidetes bacterium]|nr:MAG: preprotein translocase subunit SecB [Bacteroidota bacterium]
MNLQILHNQVISLDLQKLDKKSEKKDRLFNLAYANEYDQHEHNRFAVVFEVEILHPDDFHLKCKYVSWFKTSEVIDEQFKTSDFPKINAPAIAFPFLRGFISILTLNSGYLPAMLPSINFSNFGLAKKNDK